MTSIERLRELFDYDPLTGALVWRARRGSAAAGRVAGHLCLTWGYVVVGIDGGLYRAHRVIWAYVHGEWPCAEIDHRDGNRSNNALANLRQATVSQNRMNLTCLKRNNKSGVTGVSRDREKWRAAINVDGRQVTLGRFDDFSDAVSARRKAVVDHYGAFAPA